MRLTYLIGVPGVGKTTLIKKVTEGVPAYLATSPFARSIYPCGVVQLGQNRGTFSGTDALALNVQPRVLEWATVPDYGDVLAEGDRLANLSFLQGMVDKGFDVSVIYCHASPEVIAARLRERVGLTGGRPQDETWVRGRRTKVTNLFEDWTGRKMVLNMEQPYEELLSLAAIIPVLDTLTEARLA